MLSIPSMFIGFYTKDMIIGLGTDFWGNALFILPENMNMVDAEFIEHIYKILPVILSLCGALSSFLLYTFGTTFLFKFKFSFFGKKIYNFLNKKWFFDKVYNEIIGQFLFKFGYNISYKIIDRGIIEVLGPMGLSRIIYKQATFMNNLQTSYIYHYALSILIGCTILIFIKQFWFFISIVADFRILILLSIIFVFHFIVRKGD